MKIKTQVTPYETAARSKASKVTGTKRSELSPTFQLASEFPGLVAMVHFCLWSIFKPRMKCGFLMLQIDNYRLSTLDSDQNWVSRTVHFPTMCLAASQDPQNTKGRIRSKGSVRDQSHLVLQGYTLSSPMVGVEGKEWGVGGRRRRKKPPQFNNSFLETKHAKTSPLQAQV